MMRRRMLASVSGADWKSRIAHDSCKVWFDGIERGNDVSIWKNIAGNGGNGSVESHAEWTNDSLKFKEADGNFACSFDGTITNRYTIETVASVLSVNNSSGRFVAESPYPSLYAHENGGMRIGVYSQGVDNWDRSGIYSYGTRHHVAITFNGFFITVYVDGKIDRNIATTTNPNSVQVATLGGRIGGGRGFTGEICSFLRHERVLSADEIENNFTEFRRRFGLP